MRGVDDGPDGLNEAAFDRALGISAKQKRARKPKPSPFEQCRRALFVAVERLEAKTGFDTVRFHYQAGLAVDAQTTVSVWSAIVALRQADDAATLFAGIREACR